VEVSVAKGRDVTPRGTAPSGRYELLMVPLLPLLLALLLRAEEEEEDDDPSNPGRSSAISVCAVPAGAAARAEAAWLIRSRTAAE
jgi:hypothetical protein